MPFIDDSNRHTNGMDSTTPVDALLEPKKLVLCFDGTGNTFSGSNADTNVVKILNKLDRHAPRQFHYYQSEPDSYKNQGPKTNRANSWNWNI
ncbi:hypothetical protein RRF57_012451 [Xylaria bambusicola]|uniref:T6SS Phospholipase effector Tle1-like catalytic domain-containing protein n=1 Tax=Xylaria bambusicola TaxID=326684 RepID=A0AAN7V5N0_9PEZI